MKRKIRFGIFADLHVDIIHDPEIRLKEFLDVAKKADVDFIIQLGDFCYPDDNRFCVCPVDQMPYNVRNAMKKKTYADKAAIIGMFNNFEKPSFHVFGNHECDVCTKKETMEFLGINGNTYYSFDMGGFHFVVLDGNFYKEDGNYYAFENGNYFAKSDKTKTLPYLPPEQIKWLKDDLASTELPSILFSHQCLGDAKVGGIVNAADVKDIIKNAPNGVVAAFYGHAHIDLQSLQDGTWHICINSMSNFWVGSDYTCEGIYGDDIDEKYPNLRYTIPYVGSLYAIVDIDDTSIGIKGSKTEFAGPSPKDRGILDANATFGDYGSITPEIKDRVIEI